MSFLLSFLFHYSRRRFSVGEKMYPPFRYRASFPTGDFSDSFDESPMNEVPGLSAAPDIRGETRRAIFRTRGNHAR